MKNSPPQALTPDKLYYRLALKNLKSRKARTVLTTLGITIGIASLLLMLALSEGIKTAATGGLTGNSALTQLTVQQKSSQGSLLKLLPLDSQKKITPQILETIQKIPHVEKVYPEMIFGNISSLQVSWLGQGLQTDAMIFGVPYDLIAADYKGNQASWDSAAAPYPALISSKIMDIYNFTVAPASGLPQISENDLNSIDVVLFPGQSTFFPKLGEAKNTVPARIVGFSNQASLVGITIPLQVVRELNKEADPAYTDNYLRLHVQVDSAQNVESVRQQIGNIGLDAVSPLEEIKTISEDFLIVEIGLGAIGLIILFVAGLMIANTFLAAIAERKHEIGIFRALGATRADIKKIFLAEAAVIGLLGGICGIIIAAAAGLLVNKFILQSLPKMSFIPDSLFIYSPLTIILVLFFAVIVSIVFAYIPATRAARLNPLEALTQE